MIEAHIDQVRWNKLKEIERLEQQTFSVFLDKLGKKTDLGPVSRKGGKR